MQLIQYVIKHYLRDWNKRRLQENASKLRDFLFPDLWAIGLFVSSDILEDNFSVILIEKRLNVQFFHPNLNGKLFPVCSRFQKDIRRGYNGCKWFYMMNAFGNGLELLKEVQKMCETFTH